MGIPKRLPGEAKSRREVVVVGIDQSQPLEIVARHQSPRDLVEGAEMAAISIRDGADPFIPQSKIEGQAGRYLPVILGKPIEMRNSSESGSHFAGPERDERMSQQKVRHRISGDKTLKYKLPAREKTRRVREMDVTVIHSELESMIATHPCQGIIHLINISPNNLGIGGGRSEGCKSGKSDNRDTGIDRIVNCISELQDVLAACAFLQAILQVPVEPQAKFIEHGWCESVDPLNRGIMSPVGDAGTREGSNAGVENLDIHP